MKIAISNLSWPPQEDSQVLKIFNKYNIKGIELAPTKIWQSPTETNKSTIQEYRKWWNNNGVEIVATTSLLFGHPELVLFKDQDSRQKTLDYLKKMVDASSILGAKSMVFGSPKNRVKGDMSKDDVEKIALEFFKDIGEHAKKYDICFGIEPNPPLYGTDFINTTFEAVELVEKVNHPNFTVHLDASTMTINQENYLDTLKKACPFAKHFHISEPGLKIIPQNGTNHNDIAQALKEANYEGWVSIEMPLQDDVYHLKYIDSVLNYVTKIYK